MKTILALIASTVAVAAMLAPAAVQAEKADALKPVDVAYGKADFDQVTQTSIWTGNVIITRGTLKMTSDRAETRESPDGYMVAILIAAPGQMATFRQKRDGGPDLWVEGRAQRIEYDERTDLVKLINGAEIKQLDGPKITHQMNNAFISYDSRKEVLLSRNDASGADVVGQGRGHATFQTTHRAPAADAAATPSAAPATAAPAGKQ